jgi:hypothetical protein
MFAGHPNDTGANRHHRVGAALVGPRSPGEAVCRPGFHGLAQVAFCSMDRNGQGNATEFKSS